MRFDLRKKKYASISKVRHEGLILSFFSPNAICEYRNKTFSSKEPDTLSWIDCFENESTFWDVGANVGLYSIYAAKKSCCNVISFEPSVFNLEILARNIYLNKLHEKITLAPIALSNNSVASMLRLTNTANGGALSTFGEKFGGDGEPLEGIFEYKTIGMSLDGFLQVFGLMQPDYIKIDVDGLEHFILQGAHQVLSNVKAVLIEINENFQEQAVQSSMLLTRAGLLLKKKYPLGAAGYSNQLWIKNY